MNGIYRDEDDKESNMLMVLLKILLLVMIEDVQAFFLNLVVDYNIFMWLLI